MLLTTAATHRLLTIPETAETLRVSRGTVYRLVKSSGLPAVKVGQQLRVDEAELSRWLHDDREPNGGSLNG